MRDIQHACRTLIKMPVLSLVVVASLGIGIGVNTAVFSWLDAMVLRPLPGVPDAGRFVLIEPKAETGSYPGVSWPEYADLRDGLRTIGATLAARLVPLTVNDTGRGERTFAMLVSGDYFKTLDLRPAAGRFISDAEAQRPGADPVVVISHSYWLTRFGASPTALGQIIRANGLDLTVIGVTPPRFQGTVVMIDVDMFVPATLAPALFGGSRELEDRGTRGYSMMARLLPGVTRPQAQADLDASMQRLAGAYPATNAKIRAELLSFWQAPRGPQRMLAQAVVVLQAVMVLLLCAVGANAANLMLARASTRQREVGVRLALGARPGRIVRLLLIENLLLASLGAALGIALAVWGTNGLRAVPLIGGFPIKFQTSIDGLGLAVAVSLAIACGLGVGLGPAIHLARLDPHAALRAGARTAGRSRTRSALMAAEVFVASLVLMAAALFLRSFAETRDVDPGFRREGVLLAAYDLSGTKAGAVYQRTFASDLLARLRTTPGVESAAIAASVPLDIHGLPLRSFTLEGRARNDADPDRALSNVVTPGYFRTMGIPMTSGSDFVDLSDQHAPAQAIVNDEFVRRFIGKGEPIGRRIETRGSSTVIAGVVRNSVSEAFGEPPTPVIYLSYRDRPAQTGEIHVRTRPGAETLMAAAIERAVRDLDPGLPVYDIRTLSDHVEKNLFLRRIPARMFVVLGPLLLALAAVGIYAVVNFAVSRRTAEIGVRLALGASPRRVTREVASESAFVIAIGVLAAWAVMFVVDLHLLHGVVYLPVFAGVPLLTMAVGGCACWLPARRAATIDPLLALRDE
ncbi:MAG TPA: ADOP family duplicated permease [Vicinamibacterales bacterium]